MPMNKTIKINESTLECLSDLKLEHTNRYPDREITNDLVLNELISEHREYTNPKIQEEKRRKLLEGYVSKSQYDELYNENISINKKLNESTGRYENNIQEIKNSKEQLELQLTQQNENLGKLRISLANKEKEHSELETNNQDLQQMLIEVKTFMEKTKEQYDKLENDYNRQIKNCFDKECLKTLYLIARLLMRHKRSMFTAAQISSNTVIFRPDVEDALELVMYKIFPIRKIKHEDGMLYYFDRRYLRW